MVYFKIKFPQYKYSSRKKVTLIPANPDRTSCSNDCSTMKAHRAEWLPCDSDVMSPSILRTAYSSKIVQQETLFLEDISDAFYSAEVLDVRRKISLFPTFRKWVIDHRKVFDHIGPIHASDSCLHSFDSQTGYTTAATIAGASASDRVMTLNDLQILKVIGEGAFATVFKVKDRKTSRLLALKVVSKEDRRMARPDYLLREKAALRRAAGCSGLLQLEASFHDTQNYYMAVTYHCGGDLSSEIQKWRRLPTNIVRFYTAELVDALHTLHERGIIHRDIKPPNILIDSFGHLVIADFGLARLYHTEPYDIVNPYWFTACVEAQQILKGPYLTKKGCGTPEYMAPEIWMGKKYSFTVDFWALGITVYEMITGRIPWKSRNYGSKADKIMNSALRFKPQEKVDEDAQDLLQKMLTKEPHNRLQYEEMKKHSFFRGIDWDKIESHTMPAPYISYIEERKCTTDANIAFIEAGELYEPSNDPLPEFTYVSPLLDQLPSKVSLKSHIHQLLKKGFVNHVSNGVGPTFLDGLDNISLDDESYFPTCPRSWIPMSDAEVMDYWRTDNEQIVSSPVISESPVSIVSSTQSKVSKCQYSGVAVSKRFAGLASFIVNLVKPSSCNGSSDLNSPTTLVPPTTCGSPTTLDNGETKSSSKSNVTGSRKGTFRIKRWFKHTWNPIPEVKNLSGAKRKVIDLTA